MGRQSTRWPGWKIVTGMLVCAAGSIGLAYLAFYLESLAPPPANPTDATPTAGVPMASMMLVFSAASGLLAIYCGGWLIHRWRASIPAWKRPSKLGPKRR